MKKIFAEHFYYTLDDLINNLTQFPYINNGACAIVATTIYDEVNKLKKQYGFLNDLELSYYFLHNYDLDDKRKLYNQHAEFEENYVKYKKTKNEKYYDNCNDLIDDMSAFHHIMLNVSFDHKEYLIDGQGFYDDLKEYQEILENEDVFICYKTNNHSFMKKFSHDLEWWALKNHFDEPEMYINDLKKEIKQVFKQLRKELDKEIYINSFIDDKIDMVLKNNKLKVK